MGYMDDRARARQKTKDCIEDILSSMPILREASLKLYRDVPIQDIKYQGDTYDKFPYLEEDKRKEIQNSLSMDFLVCRGDEIIGAIGVITDPSDYWESEKQKLSYLPYWNINTHTRPDKYTGIAADTWIRKILEKIRKWPYSYTVQVIRPELYPILVKKYLLKERRLIAGHKQRASDILIRMPDEYGQDSGIVVGYETGRDGKRYRRLFCSDRGQKIIQENLKCDRKAIEISEQRLSLSERLTRLNAGRPSDSMYGAAIVKKFAEISIDRYLEEFPEELERLKRELNDFDGSEGNITFQQAAASVHQMFQTRAHADAGKELMYILAQPLYEEYKRRVSQCSRAS